MIRLCWRCLITLSLALLKRTSRSYASVLHVRGKRVIRLEHLWWKRPKFERYRRKCVGLVGLRVQGDVIMKPVIAAALSLLAAATPAMAQPTDVALRFECSAFTHILWACLPPSSARDTADAMTSAFMSAGMQLGRERLMSDGEVNAAAMAALQRQLAKTGNTCNRLDVLVRNYGKLCDALIDSYRADTQSADAPRSHDGS